MDYLLYSLVEYGYGHSEQQDLKNLVAYHTVIATSYSANYEGSEDFSNAMVVAEFTAMAFRVRGMTDITVRCRLCSRLYKLALIGQCSCGFKGFAPCNASNRT